MQVNPYLTFKGDCEAAFTLYERCLGGRVGQLFRYEGSPMAGDVPAGWGDKIMHGTITIGGRDVFGADMAPDKYEKPQGFTMSVNLTNPSEGERIFRELSQGGTVVMPFARTFWAAGFGVLVDQHGIKWVINCDLPA